MKHKILYSLAKEQKSKLKIDDLIRIILQNRDIKSKKEIEDFLNPKLEKITIESVGIDKKELKKTLKRIYQAIDSKEQIVIFGDYDVDGVCGTAILWEILNSMGAKVTPYIPHRIDEGYGLSIKGIENIIEKKILNQVQNDNNKGLIITVDNGIVANKPVEFANKKEIDVIITDHHALPSKNKLPKAFSIVHTTNLCGTAVAYMLAEELTRGPVARFTSASAPHLQSSEVRAVGHLLSRTTPRNFDHLELVALATVADLVPLKGANRTLLKYGLEKLRKTKRVGLLALFYEAGIDKNLIDVYEIGHIIAPRLNAMGRLEYAMNSLRLICTNDKKAADKLAQLLGNTNRQRQDLTSKTVMHALDLVGENKKNIKKLIFVSHETYEQGVIGLVAGKMVEEYYRPAIIISKGKEYSKASARSISGFNIIEFIREQSSILVDAGGHPMAAGFTVETTKLIKLQENLEKRAELLINDDLLIKSLKIDCEIDPSLVDMKLYEALQKLAPFGMGNPEPTFLSKSVPVDDLRVVGKDGKHLKLKLIINNEKLRVIDAIAFGMGEMASKINKGDKVDVVYVIDENEWNGDKKLQLKVRDISL